MKWQGRRQSSNVDDRRGQGGGSGQGFGGFSPTLLGPLVKILFSKVGLFLVGGFLVISLIM
jgi:predicted metalloprotease